MFCNFLNFLVVFFGILYSELGKNGIWNENFILSFLAYQPNLDRHNAGMIFLNFLNFFAILFGNLYSESGKNGNRNDVFAIFLAYLSPVWIQILPE